MADELSLRPIFFFALIFLIIIIFRFFSSIKKRERKSKITFSTSFLLYFLSFFIPLAGFIVGAIYVSKDDEEYKYVGQSCLMFSVLNIIIGFGIVFLVFF